MNTLNIYIYVSTTFYKHLYICVSTTFYYKGGCKTIYYCAFRYGLTGQCKVGIPWPPTLPATLWNILLSIAGLQCTNIAYNQSKIPENYLVIEMNYTLNRIDNNYDEC